MILAIKQPSSLKHKPISRKPHSYYRHTDLRRKPCNNNPHESIKKCHTSDNQVSYIDGNEENESIGCSEIFNTIQEKYYFKTKNGNSDYTALY